MAVESKQGTSTEEHDERKRPSRLRAAASSLPSVDNSLDEFIGRAHETPSDASPAFAATRDSDQQLRESQAREVALRRQLDSLHGLLVEAEARAAVASTELVTSAALESGRVTPADSGKKKMSWGLVVAALLVGAAATFAASVIFGDKGESTPEAKAPVDTKAETAAEVKPDAPAPVEPVEKVEAKAAPEPEKEAEAKVEPEKKAAPAAPKMTRPKHKPEAKAKPPARDGATSAGGESKPAATTSDDTGLVDPF